MRALGSYLRLTSAARSRLRLVLIPAATCMLVSFATACGSSAGYSSSAATSTPAVDTASPTTAASKAGASMVGSPISVTEKDFAIAVDRAQVSAGQVTFNVMNAGPSVHEFVVFKTDAAPDALPVAANNVDENAGNVRHIDEIQDVGVGESKQLSLMLDPGKYVLICNLPAHYGLGMRVGFEVR